MKCKFCGSDSKVIYRGPIRLGSSEYTAKEYDIFKCKSCGTIWNEAWKDIEDDFYESGEYRDRVDGNSEVSTYQNRYDKDVLWHLEMTGTEIFRNKIVCDVGCGGGSFLDFVNTPSEHIVAIEPNEKIHESLRSRGYSVYPYASEAVSDWADRIDVITSFDVIEHSYEPQEFVNDIYKLLIKGGKCIIGTPTDYPILRELLGDFYTRFIFTVQHPWVFSEKCLYDMFDKAGFLNIKIVPSQKFGLGNVFAWLNERKPRGDIKYPFISPAVNAAWKWDVAQNGYAEYLTVYAEK